MKILYRSLWIALLAIVLITILAISVACTPAPAKAPAAPVAPAAQPVAPAVTYSIKTANKPGVGDYLVDSKGMALYYFTKDLPGKSNAPAAVLALWPVFSAADSSVPPSLNGADFSAINRDDGAKQTTYMGWPLYYFAKDQVPGDTLGEGVAGIWYLAKAPFYTVMLQTKADLGNYLVDRKGMTLYYFTKDNAGKSNVTGAILQNWPAFNAASVVIPSVLNAADFSMITRDDGSKQVAYKGWPLYYFIKDKASGDTMGQGVNDVWYIVTDKLAAATAASASLPSATGGGY
jgi:predicted lipoprotein with Yx(FWY)xxD motif